MNKGHLRKCLFLYASSLRLTPLGLALKIARQLLGLRSRRDSTAHIHVCVPALLYLLLPCSRASLYLGRCSRHGSRSPFQTRLYRLLPCNRTSSVLGVVLYPCNRVRGALMHMDVRMPRRYGCLRAALHLCTGMYCIPVLQEQKPGTKKILFSEVP